LAYEKKQLLKQKMGVAMDSFNNSAHAGQSNLEQQLKGEYQVDIGGFLRKAWELFRKAPGQFIGFTVVLLVASQIGQLFVPDAEGVTPSVDSLPVLMLGVLASILISLLTVPLYAGVSIAGFKLMSDQEVSFSDFFRGFRYLTPLVLLAVFIGIVVFLTILVFAIPLGIGLAMVDQGGGSGGLVLGIILGLLSLVVMVYLTVSYTFAQMLIVDRRLGVWQAMETSRKVATKQWFTIFGFVLVVGLLNVLGVLALLIGLLVTMPVAYLALAVAYREIFGLESSEW